MEAARLLGAPLSRRIREVALPLARPAIAAGVALALMETLADFGGLMQCYAAGIPFVKGTLMGDFFYSAVLFGGFALVQKQVPSLRTAHA